MNKKQIINLLFAPLEKALNCIGAILNQCPDKDELKKIRNSPIFNNPYKKKPHDNFDMRNGSTRKQEHHAKGSINTDSKIFNKPRR